MMLKARIPLTEESAQTMAEYAIVLSVIGISIVIAFGVLSGAIASSIDAAVAVVRG
jgi:Flp pilus assembly pilin Flp